MSENRSKTKISYHEDGEDSSSYGSADSLINDNPGQQGASGVDDTVSPSAHRSHTTSKKIAGNAGPSVTIEDLGDTGSPLPTRSASRTLNNQENSGNNNNVALLPISQLTKTNQMIPIALLRKSSNNVVLEECPNGIMQMISCKNKVAPAESTCLDNSGSAGPTTTVGAVLMLIPKKSEASVECSAADVENNPQVESTGDKNPESTPEGASLQQEPALVKPTQSYDSYEDVCRICHDNPSKMELISPCLCKGSMSKVHRACLERWLAESAKNACEICNYEYNTVRKPKYTGCASVCQWIRNPLSPSDMRNLFFDIACFFILTPLAAISSWLCVVGAQHYTFGDERRRRPKYRNEGTGAWDVHSHDQRNDATNSTWTAIGLLSLTGTLLVAYLVWLFVAIKYHIQAWREWQQRNYTVTIVPFEDGCMGRPPPPRPPRTQTNTNNVNGGDHLIGGMDNPANIFDFDLNPSALRHSGNPLGRGRTNRNSFRSGRNNRRNYNLPPIFSRSHFLRNPPPGYTISETTLLYQALYGSDSDTFLNENILALFADSSEEVTENNSTANVDFQSPPNNHGVSDDHHESSVEGRSANDSVKRNARGLVVDHEKPSSSSAANNNPDAKAKAVGESKRSQESIGQAASHVTISIYDDDNDNTRKD